MGSIPVGGAKLNKTNAQSSFVRAFVIPASNAGAPKERVCPQCKEPLAPTAQFCSNCGAPCPAPTAQMGESVLSHEEFFQKNATRATKFWRSALPIVGFISCAIYLIIGLLCMITFTYPFNGILYLLDFLVVGGLSFAMLFTKKTVFYIILTVYMGVALILAALDLDFSNIFWLGVGIYISIKLYKIDNQYKAHVNRGMYAHY